MLRYFAAFAHNGSLPMAVFSNASIERVKAFFWNSAFFLPRPSAFVFYIHPASAGQSRSMSGVPSHVTLALFGASLSVDVRSL